MKCACRCIFCGAEVLYDPEISANLNCLGGCGGDLAKLHVGFPVGDGEVVIPTIVPDPAPLKPEPVIDVRDRQLRGDVRRAAHVEYDLLRAAEALDAALDRDEDLLRILGILDLVKSLHERLKPDNQKSPVRRVRHYLASLDATHERPINCHPTPEGGGSPWRRDPPGLDDVHRHRWWWVRAPAIAEAPAVPPVAIALRVADGRIVDDADEELDPEVWGGAAAEWTPAIPPAIGAEPR